MKTITELNASKVPLVVIDKKLNGLDNVVLFPKKVEKAKKIIEKIGLPKQKLHNQANENQIPEPDFIGGLSSLTKEKEMALSKYFAKKERSLFKKYYILQRKNLAT